ncbi:fumarylacetoacetate hydrolase family protein [Aminobacter sp. HY435]|uniref:fumarylacetoacetate hydrolase family protein n=1 Tax=Aminobacter sp. HY435 TaxID=2970917 RepID=UPI0022B95016|nr:fumarylacetoacetate hydrolase family protein [Aminobacter sp. HY435]
MRLCSYLHNGRAGYGVVADDRVIDISSVLGDRFPTLANLLAEEDFLDICTQAIGRSSELPLAGIALQAPIPNPGKIICVGLNYHDHMVETRHAPTQHPTLFARFADSQCAHGEPMLMPSVSTEFDFEAELAVVIGKSGRKLQADAALDHVAGYSCYNDGSVRDWQVHTSQFLPGKNFPATGAFGPFLVTADEIPDPQDLAISCRLNGNTVQAARTSQMIHSVAELIAYISRITPLSPGDVIVTGTPGGVGFARVPPLFMKEGDLVEVDIEGVGLLRNRIARETIQSA